MLFNEPKLLKYFAAYNQTLRCNGFSALQRAEIAEIYGWVIGVNASGGFSALQRAEIAEIITTVEGRPR